MSRRSRHPGLVAVPLLLSVSGRALAQPTGGDEGPVVVGGGEPNKLRAFELDHFDASLDFYARYLRSHQSSPTAGDLTDTETLFRESLGVSSRFFLGHENLADVHANFSLGLEDNFINSDTQGLDNAHEDGLFTLFDVNALILGEGPAPLTIFARRNESLLDRAFAGSITSTNTEFGASVRLFTEVVPTTITLSRRIVEQNDQFAIADEKQTQDTAQIQSTWDPGNGHRLSFDYVLDLVDEQRIRSRDVNFTRHDALLVHTYTFGAEEQHDIRSQLRLFDQTGDYQQQRIRLFETLTLRHSDTLETRYDVTLENRKTLAQSQKYASGIFTLRHELFDSLVTTFNTGANYTALPDDDYDSTELFTGVDFDYTKRVPLGRLDISLALNADYQDDSTRGHFLSFFDVPRVFPDASPVLLTGQNIVPGSIVITDPSGLNTLVEGLDYRQLNFSDRIELRRLVGGAIAPGDSVLVDYDLGPSPAATIQTFSGSIAGRYTIYEGVAAGLSPYAMFYDISQSIDTTDPDRIPFDSRVIRVGADYRVGLFTFNAEYENHDSSISPFDAIRANARYDRLLGLNSFLRIDLSHDTIDFGSGGSRNDLDRILAEWAYAFNNGIQIRLRGIYRNERDSIAGSSQGFEQSLELGWQLRQTSIAVSLRNAILEGNDVKSDSQYAVFTLRRQF